jgi:hypothetical protein
MLVKLYQLMEMQDEAGDVTLDILWYYKTSITSMGRR